MIIIICGMPGAGKSYTACDLIVKAWQSDPNRRIFTNFPVQWKGKSTMKFSAEMLHENIFGSLIVIDEAYQMFYSRNWKGFSEDDLLVFATARHNENTFVILSQSLASVDAELRRRAEIWWVSKVAIPKKGYLLEYDHWHPLWFKAEIYDGEDNYKMRLVAGKNAILKKKRYLFRKSIAKIYDTHYYGLDVNAPFRSDKWFDEPNQEHRNRFPRLFDVIGTFRRLYSNGNLSNLRVSDENENRTRGNLWRNLGFQQCYGRTRRCLGTFQKLLQSINPLQRRTRPRYDLWERRGIIRTIIYTNWMLWKPVFRILRLE